MIGKANENLKKEPTAERKIQAAKAAKARRGIKMPTFWIWTYRTPSRDICQLRCLGMNDQCSQGVATHFDPVPQSCTLWQTKHED